MEFYWVKHPRVEKPAQVPESALAFWEGRGWDRTDEPQPPTPEPDEEPAPPVLVDTTKSSSRAQRRHATEE